MAVEKKKKKEVTCVELSRKKPTLAYETLTLATRVRVPVGECFAHRS